MARGGCRVVAGLVMLLAGACGTSPEVTAPESGAAPSGRIEVQVSGGPSELEALEQVVAGFEQRYPGTEISLLGVADQREHIAKLATAFAGGVPPDLFLVNHRRLGTFAESGAVEPADPGPIDVAGLYPLAVAAFTFDGTLLCLPQNASSVVTYVNPALFARAGVALPAADWTWPDALAAARALAAKGIEAVGFDPELRSVAPLVWSAGGEVVDDTAHPTRVTLATPEGRKALRFLLELQQTGLDATERAASTPQARFAGGELAMYFDSRRAVPGFRKAGTPFDVAPVPRDARAASLLASDGWCVSKAARNKALARTFAQYAVGGDGATILAKAGRTVPSLRSLAESESFLDPTQPPRSARVFLDVIPSLRQLPSVAPWDDAEARTNDTLTQLFAGRTSLDAAVEEIATETAAALA